VPQKNSSSYGAGVGALLDIEDVVAEAVVDAVIEVLDVVVAFEASDNDAENSFIPESVELKLAELVSGTGVVLASGAGVLTNESLCA